MRFFYFIGSVIEASTVNARVNNLLDEDFTSYRTSFASTDNGLTYTPSYTDDYNNKYKSRSYWLSLNTRF